MADKTDYAYDVFISHSPQDEKWVEEWLQPRLERAGLRVAASYRDFVTGTPTLENIERCVRTSRRTLVVLTPEWIKSEWNAFEALLLRSADPAARARKLLPVLLKPCDLPDFIAALTMADLTVERHWEKRLKRLTRDIADTVPVSFPANPRDMTLWKKWIRRYRRELEWGAVGLLVVWLVVSMARETWPFQRRSVWVAETLPAPHAIALHNTGAVLLVGAANVKPGCNLADKGLWYRPLQAEGEWQNSDVGNLLCIENWSPPSLSDIVAFASLPAEPNTIYALTSHSGLLVSVDGGAHFALHSAGIPPLEKDNPPALLVVNQNAEPTIWVAGRRRGLLVYRAGRWSQLDGANGSCSSAALAVRSLSVAQDTVIIGTDRQGLWQSADGGRTCRPVMDSDGRYMFYQLRDVSQTYPRYLAVVYDYRLEPGGKLGTWQLLDLCPRPASCSPTEWQPEPNPLWDDTDVVKDLAVQRNTAQDYEWFLVTHFGRVWQGDLRGGMSQQRPGIHRCFLPVCDARLAPSPTGNAPYLLAANVVDERIEKWISPGRVYDLTQGAWWRAVWP